MTSCSYASEFVLPVYGDETRRDLSVSAYTQPVFQINIPRDVAGFEARVEGQGSHSVMMTVEDYPSRFSGQIIEQTAPGASLTFYAADYTHGSKGEIDYDVSPAGDRLVYLRLQADSASDDTELTATLVVTFLDAQTSRRRAPGVNRG